MAKSVSIAITAKDNFSTAINSMRNANQAFSKDLTGLQSKMDALNRTKATLKVDVAKAKADLKEAEKHFTKTTDAVTKLQLEMAHSNYENARRNLSLVSTEASNAEKQILNLTSALSKSENRAGGGTSFKEAASSISNTIVASGMASAIGDLFGSITNAYVGSAFGSEAGTLFGSVLSGVGMGAAIGSMIPGIGTAIGAALGGVVGLVEGAVKVFESKDEAFKEYYKSQYDTVVAAQKDALESGSVTASNREQKMIAFSTLLGGEDAARSYLGEMTEFATKTPFSYDELANISKTLLAYGYQQKEILPLLTSIGDAGSALGLGGEDMAYMASYLGRMRTTGKTTMEYLNPLLERGIDVYKAISKMPEAAGKTNKEIQEMVSKGLIPGGEAAQAIADYMGETYAGNMAKQAETFGGLTSTLEDAQANLNNAMGEGYNQIRKTDIKEQTQWLEGESGAAMLEAYNKIGQYQASLLGQQEQLVRDAYDSVMSGTLADSYKGLGSEEDIKRLMTEYKVAEAAYYDASKSGNRQAMDEAGAEMGRILAEAQAVAQNEYNAGPGGQLFKNTQLELADNLKNDAGVKEAYYGFGYEMGVRFSKGMVDAQMERWTIKTEGSATPFDRPSAYTGRATGLSYVPYDNFPAMLHEGERVLTASENRGYGSGVSVRVSGNNFTIREEADVDKVAKALAREIVRAKALAVE
jgi:tape measure domain-containing protein